MLLVYFVSYKVVDVAVYLILPDRNPSATFRVFPIDNDFKSAPFDNMELLSRRNTTTASNGNEKDRIFRVFV